MNRFEYTNRAKDDLLDIGRYSVGEFGAVQAARYLEALQSSCELLAQIPSMGRIWRHKGREFRRMEVNRHVVFYRQKKDGVLVVRILHGRMLPAEQSFDET